MSENCRGSLARQKLSHCEKYAVPCPKNIPAFRELPFRLCGQGFVFDAVVTSDNPLAVGGLIEQSSVAFIAPQMIRRTS